MTTELWEILVPASNNKDLNFTFEHHKEWDAFVKDLTGGVTILKTAKGEWLSPTGELYIDRMIPCRIACSYEELSIIIDFTIEHYKQEAVLAYKISDDVILRYKKDLKLPERPIVRIIPEGTLKLPKPPLSRIIKEGTVGTCPECGSTETKVRNIPGKHGCINPECPNYYDKRKKRLL